MWPCDGRSDARCFIGLGYIFSFFFFRSALAPVVADPPRVHPPVWIGSGAGTRVGDQISSKIGI